MECNQTNCANCSSTYNERFAQRDRNGNPIISSNHLAFKRKMHFDKIREKHCEWYSREDQKDKLRRVLRDVDLDEKACELFQQLAGMGLSYKEVCKITQQINDKASRQEILIDIASMHPSL